MDYVALMYEDVNCDIVEILNTEPISRGFNQLYSVEQMSDI